MSSSEGGRGELGVSLSLGAPEELLRAAKCYGLTQFSQRDSCPLRGKWCPQADYETTFREACKVHNACWHTAGVRARDVEPLRSAFDAKHEPWEQTRPVLLGREVTSGVWTRAYRDAALGLGPNLSTN